MSREPDTGTLGNPSLGGLADQDPIVVHGPVQGSVGLGGNAAERPQLQAVTPEPGPEPAATDAWVPHQSQLPVEAAASARADSLDALRGLLLVMMTLGFTIHGSYFPDWMYHRQFPPPGEFRDIAGIAWRDLAYAAFIFSMAAALPITLSRRMEKGQTEIAIFVAIARRFGLLFLFALLIGHSNTYFIGYTQTGRLVALLGFAIMFMAFLRRPPGFEERSFRVLNRLGWVAAIAFLAASPLLYGSTFSPERRDDIIAGLAFAALSGSVVWYLTRENLAARMAVLGATVALYLGSRSQGWVQDWWWTSPAPWLLRPSSLSLLTVVIPGTIAGDLLLRWMRSPETERGAAGARRGRLAMLAALCIAAVPVTVIGLYNRWSLETTQIIMALSLAGVIIMRNPTTDAERLARGLFLWGALWLLLGLFVEPAEGGIRKVPETLAYFFTVTGLTTFLLVALVVLVDVLPGRRWARTLIDVGQNPMLTYVMYPVLLNSLLELITPLRPVLRASPGEAMLRSIIMVAVVVLLVQMFTRRRIFWRT